LFSQLSESTPA